MDLLRNSLAAPRPPTTKRFTPGTLLLVLEALMFERCQQPGKTAEHSLAGWPVTAHATAAAAAALSLQQTRTDTNLTLTLYL